MSTSGCDKLEKENPSERDSRCYFNDDMNHETKIQNHDYYIKLTPDATTWTKLDLSVTGFVHEYFGHFDPDEVIPKIMKKREYKFDPTYRYYQMSAEAIKKQWDDLGKEASNLGSIMHLNIEKHYNEHPYEDDSPEFKMFLQFAQDYKHLKPFRTEMIVFSEYYMLAGSIDMIFEDQEGNLLVYDWKRSKEFKYENRWQKGNSILSYLDDCNITHYTLQLNAYKFFIEKYYHRKVTDMCLVRCHPNLETYDRVPVPNMQKEIHMMLDEREILLYPHKEKEIRERQRLQKLADCIKDTPMDDDSDDDPLKDL
uniref:Uncharacterized protein n=1 Tax=Megaviridae environmental sample TaxID=1737588 RepID=A0A5J6VHI8_9VIRU|nr:MAG: hypothetical protein [Megaviridae environmental sample]